MWFFLGGGVGVGGVRESCFFDYNIPSTARGSHMHVSECCVSECVCVFCAWVGGGVSERVDFWIISFHQLHSVPIYACQRVLCECVGFFWGGVGE